MKVNDLPALDVWVTEDCASCARTLVALSACDVIKDLVRVEVHLLGDPGEFPPRGVIGGPAIVFQGTVVALGTPDCSQLAGRIMPLLGARAEIGGD
jgi:hypothetical protein